MTLLRAFECIVPSMTKTMQTEGKDKDEDKDKDKPGEIVVGGKSSLAKTDCGCAGEEERLSRREPGKGSEESSSRMY